MGGRQGHGRPFDDVEYGVVRSFPYNITVASGQGSPFADYGSYVVVSSKAARATQITARSAANSLIFNVLFNMSNNCFQQVESHDLNWLVYLLVIG